MFCGINEIKEIRANRVVNSLSFLLIIHHCKYPPHLSPTSKLDFLMPIGHIVLIWNSDYNLHSTHNLYIYPSAYSDYRILSRVENETACNGS